MILDIYKDSLEYSAKDWKTLVKLGVFAFFSFLLIPIFLIAGYNYRVMDIAVHGIINGRDPLPEFDDLVGMFVDGVKVLIIQIAYLIVPTLLFIIFVLIANQFSGVTSSAILIIGALITFIIGILAFLMREMGTCNMAYNDGSFFKAFAISELKDIIAEIGWFECLSTYIGLVIITVTLAFVVSMIIGIIFAIFGISGAMLGADTTVIFIVGVLVNFVVGLFIVGPYLSIFNSRSMGLLYAMQG